eukprot:6170682-Lingulodinium_polyedra.AAC.1
MGVQAAADPADPVLPGTKVCLCWPPGPLLLPRRLLGRREAHHCERPGGQGQSGGLVACRSGPSTGALRSARREGIF